MANPRLVCALFAGALERMQPMKLPALADEPLFSILIANFNYGRFISRALSSVLVQDYGHWELIVVDDGSTDDSVSIVERLAARDNRVTLVVQRNAGQAAALNTAYSKARGDVVCLLDADDYYLPHKLTRLAQYWRSHRGLGAGMCVHAVRIVSGDERVVSERSPSRLDAGWLAGAALVRGGAARLSFASAISFRREVANRVFPIPVRHRRAADGYAMTCAIFVTNVMAVAEPLAAYRLHGGNLTGALEVTKQRMLESLEDIESQVDSVAAFLEREYGKDVAAQLNSRDHPRGAEARLALYLMEDRGHAPWVDSIPDLLARLTRTRRRVWRGLLFLPRPVALKILNFWWGQSPVKTRLRSLRDRLRALLRAGTGDLAA